MTASNASTTQGWEIASRIIPAAEAFILGRIREKRVRVQSAFPGVCASRELFALVFSQTFRQDIERQVIGLTPAPAERLALQVYLQELIQELHEENLLDRSQFLGEIGAGNRLLRTLEKQHQEERSVLTSTFDTALGMSFNACHQPVAVVRGIRA